jgi:uncharacterized membrane protein/protein-disulfide isomerase
MVKSSFKSIIASLGLKVSNRSIELSDDANNYNLASLSNQLKDWNVNTLAVKLTKAQLSEIPYPAIAHLNTKGGQFVIIQGFDKEFISYVDHHMGTVSKSIIEFEKEWSGAILLVEANQNSGEDGYKEKRRLEIFELLALVGLLFFATVIWTLQFFFIKWPNALFYILSAIGSAVSFLLTQKQFGINIKALNSICKIGYQIDCNSVINSSASKPFGIINLSEIGLWYFTGCVVSIALAGLATVSVEPFLFVSTLVGVALSFFGIYYQGLVLKKWCPLCLAVVAVLWLQAGFYFVFLPAMVVSFKSFSVLFIGFSLPLIFWLSVRKRVLDSFKVPNLERTLNRFLKSDRIFQKLLEDQPIIETSKFSHELQSGSLDAPIHLIVVSNPQCGPCAYTHAVIGNMKNFLHDRVNVIYRFAVNTSNPSTVPYRMLETLFTIQQRESNERALEALTAWYNSNNLDQWRKQHAPTYQLKAEVNPILKEHEQWCAKVGIQKTPTIIINGKLLPEEFSVNELKFQLRKLAEKITEPELQ